MEDEYQAPADQFYLSGPGEKMESRTHPLIWFLLGVLITFIILEAFAINALWNQNAVIERRIDSIITEMMRKPI